MMISALTTVATLALLGGTASATPAADASTQPILSGPVVAGVCVLSPDAVLANSKVGIAANLHLKQIARETQDQIQGERTPLETEARAIQTEGKTLSAQQLAKRQEALSVRVKALQDETSKKERDLEYTRNKVIGQISQQAQPVINAIYKSHSCGVLFRREAVIGGNPTNDLTPEIIRGLDARLTTIDFNLESPPVTAQPAKPAA